MAKSNRNIFNYITPKAMELILKISKIDIYALKRYNCIVKKTGVYFLFKNNEIIYIGQSKDIESRILSHEKTKDFDEYSYLLISIDELNAYERVLLNIYQPILNKDCVTKNIKNNNL